VNIIHVLAGPLAGGAETLVRDLSCAQVASGDNVLVIFLDDAVSVNRSAQFQVEYLNSLDRGNVAYTFLSNSTRTKSPFRLIKAVFEFRGVVKRFSADVVHMHLLRGLVLGELGVITIPKFYTHHNSVIRSTPLIFRLLLRNVRSVIGISEEISGYLDELGVRSVLIPNAIDSQSVIRRTSPVTCLKRGIMVGRLAAQKNYLRTIEALAALPSDFTVDIYGDGYQKELIQQSIEEFGVQDRVTLKGNCPTVRQRYCEYDFFLLTSIHEGLPIVLLEAGFSGLYLISTNVGGCKAVVDRFGFGSTIEGYDKKQLVQGISASFVEFPFVYSQSKNCEIYDIKSSVSMHRACYLAS
jgi:glycosyltransferase involved in cell wall biosynthesis